jgi:hypothetical protein
VALPETGVVVLTDARLMMFEGGRRGATLTPVLGDLAVAVDRQQVRLVAYDNGGQGWQTLSFHLDDGRTLPVAVPKRDVGQWLEQFPSADGDPELA